MNALLGKHWHHLPASEVLDLLDSDTQQGLDIFEIKHRADIRLIASRDPQLTEAVLAESRNMAYASTLVTYGTATGVAAYILVEVEKWLRRKLGS